MFMTSRSSTSTAVRWRWQRSGIVWREFYTKDWIVSGHTSVITMTKLAQWLFGLTLLGTTWVTLNFDLLGLDLPQTYKQVIWPLPVYLLVAFGCYSLATIGYRVATFNDCEDAAKELQEQIKAAKKDLSSRGLRF